MIINIEKGTFNGLVEIYSKSRDEYNYTNFLLGNIIENKDEYLVTKTIDEYGFLDSCTIIIKDDISKIETNTKYTDRFHFFVEFNQKNGIYDSMEINKKYLDFSFDSIFNILDYCKKNSVVISIYCNNDQYVHQGRVLSLDSDRVRLDELQYSYYAGTEDVDNNEFIKINDITAIDVINKENLLFEAYLDSL